MALPLILIGVPIVLGVLGAKKGYDGYVDNEAAKDTLEAAQWIFDNAFGRLDRARKRTNGKLEALGHLKLEVWKENLDRFAKLYGQLHPIDLVSRMDATSGRVPVTPGVLRSMRDQSRFATEVLAGGAAALGTGALAGVAAYGGAMSLATASTGTAIATLSGAAAKSATLAWFGGGSLTAGGLGVAGGTAVLGGIVAGPVLLVAGGLYAARANANLAKARGSYFEAVQAAEEISTARLRAEQIGEVADRFANTIRETRSRFVPLLDRLEDQIARSGSDYREFDRDQRVLVHTTVLFAQVLKQLIDTPFLEEDGAIRAGYEDAFETARKALELPE